MDQEFLTSERQRFARVMNARTTDAGLTELFQKLAASDKFSDEAKPYCYADLITEAVRRIGDAEVPNLLKAVEKHNVARKVRAVMSEEEGNKVFCGLVGRAFSRLPKETEPLLDFILYCERVSITREYAYTIALALEAGLSYDLMDDICDLTHEAYRNRPYLQAA
ncbi:hypothetical protein [Burkholderia ubonensis]|uniref:hypothetical protein n=1 Tax=Burkholderia ubonensis TaxID=101571 RepID=UPI000759DF51|nr:hypothetical protein [Burkholderia ubonensis]KVP39939.1 hypothetical protein WJ87_07075 [Burkholderia ubonensis]